jgi:uncharacterized protein (DUF1800 family)
MTMRGKTGLAPLLLTALAAAPAGAQVEWNARNAEHLLNRAGFGARAAEIDYALRTGHEAYVDQLLAGFGGEGQPFFLDIPPRPTREDKKGLTEEERTQLKNQINRDEREQLGRYAAWWVERMLDGRDPLRERMTLFWHGHFTTAYREVKEIRPIIRQNELLREYALGNFGELTREIVRDPAMIRYLDNDKNRKDNPNENLARELMELFTLGEGNYTEQDVKEAARALTGYDYNYSKGVTYSKRRHDAGKKRVLGERGRLDTDDLIDVLLEQEACPRLIAGKLLAWFEGREPSEERLASYAAFLREVDYEIEPFLRRLFLDPEFYSDQVIGNKIAGPVEYVVSNSRRLGIEPPSRVLWVAAGELGQRLFEPPSVKGWDEGTAWITTSSLLQRGNIMGMLLGVVAVQDVLAPEEPMVADDSMMEMDSPIEPTMEDGMDESYRLNKKVAGADMGAYKRMLGKSYWPRINLTERCRRLRATSDEEIVDLLCAELLAVDVTPEGRSTLLYFVRSESAELGGEPGELLELGYEGERLLRRLAHLILSLPEAQLL